LFAVAMLAANDPALRVKLDAYRAHQTEVARGMTVPPAL
jgi:5-(carboxyamino)imidazole ribonucleotide mutase